jgi:aldehyde dehydrogenase
MQYASQNLIPITLELGGKSPNIFFEDVLEKDDAFFDKCLEGFTILLLIKEKFVLVLVEL